MMTLFLMKQKGSRLLKALSLLLSLYYSGVTGQQTVSVHVAVGDTAQLACPTEGNALIGSLELSYGYTSGIEIILFTFFNSPDASPTVIEYHGGKYSLDTGTWIVSIHDVEISDEEEYNCNVRDISPMTHNNFYSLRVYDTPSRSLISAPDLTGNPPQVAEGSIVKIVCRINSVNPTDNLSFSLKSSSTTVESPKHAPSDGSSVAATFNSVEILVQHGQPDSRLYCELLGYTALAGSDFQQQYQYLDIAVCQKATITSDSSSPVNAGVSVSITCSAVCSQTQSVTLYKGSGGDVTAIGSNSGSHSVTLTRQDNGVPFYCDIPGWSSDVRSNNKYFTVHYPPAVSLSHSCGDINEGEDCTLRCQATDGHPDIYTYQWRFKETTTSTFQLFPGEESDTLELTSVPGSRDGKYRCDVTNAADTVSSNVVTLNVNVCQRVSMVSDPDTSSPVNAGVSVSITCSAVCSESLTQSITLYKGSGEVVNEFESNSGPHSVTLTRQDNAVPFYCDIPGWNIDVRSDSVVYTVYNLPTVSLTHTCGDINEGEDCTLTCDASDGNPDMYTYEWRFHRKFTSTFELLSGESSDTLELASVTRSFAGQYRCEVSNAAGTVGKDVALNVNYAPTPFGALTFHGAPRTQITQYIQVTSYPSPARVDSWPDAFTDRERETLANDVTRFTFTVIVEDERSFNITIRNGDNSLSTHVTLIISPQ